MAALKRLRNEAFFKEPSRQSRFTDFFALPSSQDILIEVMAVFHLASKTGNAESKRSPTTARSNRTGASERASAIYAGKLYLSPAFLCFASLDKRSCKFAIPLATIKRVEKVGQNSRSGSAQPVVAVFALAIELYEGHRFQVQLNALRTTCDQFTQLFTQNLKAAKPQMKTMPILAKTCFSDWLTRNGNVEGLNSSKNVQPHQKNDDPSSANSETAHTNKESENSDWTTVSGSDPRWHGGQGQIFKYPGDPKR